MISGKKHKQNADDTVHRKGQAKLPWRLASKFILLLVIFCFALATLVSLVGGEKASEYFEEVIFPNLRQQSEYLIRDLRNKFDDQQYLIQLSERLHIEFVIEKRGRKFATSVELVKFLANPEQLEIYGKKKYPHKPSARHKRLLDGKRNLLLPGIMQRVEWNDRPGLLYRERGFAALIFFDKSLVPPLARQVWILLTGTVILLVLALFVAAWFLRPLVDLKKGISNIEEGIYDRPIKQRSKDELGLLARAFNRMSQRISEQFRAREQLLGDISHELRSPLTRMKIALEFMEDTKAARMVKDDINEQELLLTTLLDNARLGAGGNLDLQSIDIKELLARIIQGYRKSSLQLKAPEKKFHVRADKTLLPRVFINLIDNALKYAPSKSRVIVEILEKGQQIEISVSDNGPGIADEEKIKVFDAFYRVDKSRTRGSGGCGLGLSLCKRITEAHGGTIDIVDNTPTGTKVRVRLSSGRKK